MEQEEQEKQSKKKKLQIPANVSDRQEFFVGFGMEELKVVGVGAIIGGILAVLIYLLIREFIVPFFIWLIAIYISFAFSFRNKYGENAIEKIKYFFEYRRHQKIYLYQYVPLVRYEETGRE